MPSHPLPIRFPSIESRTGTFLPSKYWLGHEFCFFLHDVMARLLASGERASIFRVPFELRNEAEVEGLKKAKDFIDWVEQYRSPEEKAAVLATHSFPAVLSDMLHYIYEALETSRKAKLNVSYTLLRKPIQESLYLLEAVAVDRSEFSQKLSEDPLKLGSQGAGGREAHAKNITTVLEAISNDGRFNAEYLAQLRYDKSANDGFDGICNKAIHLFTGHKAIATEKMNINFVFSDEESKETQWAFLYSRLPYILAYTCQIVEHVCSDICKTVPQYIEEIQRRTAAYAILWGQTIDSDYREPCLDTFIAKNRQWLNLHCEKLGFRTPTEHDLIRIIETGAMPGESRWRLWRRMRRFQIEAEASESTDVSLLSKAQRVFGLHPLI